MNARATRPRRRRAARAACPRNARPVELAAQLLTACRARVGTGRAAGRAVGERRARPAPRLLPARRAARTATASRCSSTRCPTATRAIPTSPPIFPAAEPDAARRRSICVGIAVRGRRPAPVAVARELADRPVSAAPRFRGARRKWQPGQEEYAFVQGRRRRRARDPGRARCTPASSSPGTSASRSSARKCCGSRSGSVTCTRASRSASNRWRCSTAHRLAGRVSGDSTVAYAWAYAQAVEGIAGVAPPPRAAWLRALCLERERIANHLGDLGALGNDGGFAFGLAQFSRLREDVLRSEPARRSAIGC